MNSSNFNCFFDYVFFDSYVYLYKYTIIRKTVFNKYSETILLKCRVSQSGVRVFLMSTR